MMRTFRQVCRKNWYIIASTLLLAVFSEVLCGIMIYDRQYFNPENVSFYIGMTAISTLISFAGMVFVYFSFEIFRMKYASLIATVLTVCVTLFKEEELNLLLNYDLLCFVAAMLSLAFYYVNYCKDSVVHTVLYITEISVLSYIMLDEIELYIVMLIHIFLVITNNNTIKRKLIKVINWIFTGFVTFMLTMHFVYCLTDQIRYRYIDGYNAEGSDELGYYAKNTILLLEKMMMSAERSSASEFFGEFANESFAYNLAKIFGYYGYEIGAIAVLLIFILLASVLIGCSKKQEKMKPAAAVAATILTIRTVSAFLINFGFISILELHMPILTVCPCSALVVGMSLGIIFAADKEETDLKENDRL